MLNEGLKIVDPSSIRSDSNSKTKKPKKDISNIDSFRGEIQSEN